MLKYHRLVSFMLYTLGIIAFVLNLKKGHYKFQFNQFGITHMTMILVIAQSQFIVSNIFEGLIWFLVPVLIVVCNDVCAYLCGTFFGRTPLIRISPKKTWEGFVGGFVITLVLAFILSGYLAESRYLICSIRNDIWWNYWSYTPCLPNPVFDSSPHPIPPSIRLPLHYLGIRVSDVRIAPIQWHSLVLAFFGSIIAPFGGFFASGFKRAFKVKDFSESIPGHGGFTDRVDCQFLMAFFSYLYIKSFIEISPIDSDYVLNLIINKLSMKEQLEVYAKLGDYLVLGQSSDEMVSQ
jgi:phosphatidate cytidylyltransferase